MGIHQVYVCDRGGCDNEVRDELPEEWEVIYRVDPHDVIAREKYYYCPDCEDFTPPNEPMGMTWE